MMRTLTKNELNEVIRKHKLWLNEMEGGERANLSEVNMWGADLSGADLTGAYLRGADLSEADLRGADLIGADLSGADLSRANLSGANLSNAYLWGADLSGANLIGTNLSGAYLSEADLSRANLSGANMSGACMWGANLSGAIGIPHLPIACPEEGAFIGFKKALSEGDTEVIIKLLILEESKRSSATTNKCRCSKAKVLDIQDIFGNSVNIVARSKFDPAFVYKIGEIVEVKDFDEDRYVECGAGIHFFINRQDAVNY